MILKILASQYYGHQGKTKALFMKHYKKIGLKWMENVELSGNMVDGWFSSDMKEYLLKLVEEGEYKRFTGNSKGMINLLLSYGAVEFDEDSKGEHINYNDNKGFITQEDRFGHFVGADLYSSYRIRELLSKVPDDMGIVWNEKKIDNCGKSNVRKRIVRRIPKDERK